MYMCVHECACMFMNAHMCIFTFNKSVFSSVDSGAASKISPVLPFVLEILFLPFNSSIGRENELTAVHHMVTLVCSPLQWEVRVLPLNPQLLGTGKVPGQGN